MKDQTQVFFLNLMCRAYMPNKEEDFMIGFYCFETNYVLGLLSVAHSVPILTTKITRTVPIH